MAGKLKPVRVAVQRQMMTFASGVAGLLFHQQF